MFLEFYKNNCESNTIILRIKLVHIDYPPKKLRRLVADSVFPLTSSINVYHHNTDPTFLVSSQLTFLSGNESVHVFFLSLLSVP